MQTRQVFEEFFGRFVDPIGKPVENAEAVSPRTPTEEMLVGIWSDVLGAENVGVYDEFFALGGHSLLATLVISRLHKAYQVELPLRSLFELTTVAALAERVETVRWAAQDAQGAPSEAAGEREVGEL